MVKRAIRYKPKEKRGGDFSRPVKGLIVYAISKGWPALLYCEPRFLAAPVICLYSVNHAQSLRNVKLGFPELELSSLPTSRSNFAGGCELRNRLPHFLFLQCTYRISEPSPGIRLWTNRAHSQYGQISAGFPLICMGSPPLACAASCLADGRWSGGTRAITYSSMPASPLRSKSSRNIPASEL